MRLVNPKVPKPVRYAGYIMVLQGLLSIVLGILILTGVIP